MQQEVHFGTIMQEKILDSIYRHAIFFHNYLKVQSHYSECITYANFRESICKFQKKRLLNPRLSTTVLDKLMNSVSTAFKLHTSNVPLTY